MTATKTIGAPPWVRHPRRHRWSSFWLEEPGRMSWQAALAAIPREARVAYFRGYKPIPALWMDEVASCIEGVWEHEDERSLVDQVARVEAATGLVSVRA
ncbi:MAG: hypothetical protein KC420_10335 [Myxococcales bacterium]|nr:hypothetical protein [Myxococcales bacterium]